MTRPLTIADLEYDLPQDRIATHPVEPRSSAKLLVVSKGSLKENQVHDLPELLPDNAVLVVNETTVLPARFMATRKESCGKVEGLFLELIEQHWLVMLKSNGKLRSGIILKLSDELELELVERIGANWKCTCSDARAPQDVLAEIGTTPIPPYILRARGEETVPEAVDKKDYQTVYADPFQNNSVAAPTAGLHFDDSLLEELTECGIHRIPVTLHVGAGTFKGIETDTIKDHVMHFESWSVSQETLNRLKQAKLESRPIIAVGTTTVRTLESLPEMESWPSEGGLAGSTNLMITPPYDFCIVDGMLTNFHLPKSTLLTLVAAKIGIDQLHSAYAKAIDSGFRFYSFGDAMLILP